MRHGLHKCFLWLCATIVLVLQPSWAQSIVGPQQGSPGQQLVFRLMNSSTQVAVDSWVQMLNPDRYAGNDYVTSLMLQMQVSPDGTLTAVAPAPGRYKIAAWHGGNSWQTYVLVKPSSVVPAVRGFTFAQKEAPLDQAQASRVFALSKKAGATWAMLVETGGLDLDSPNLQITPYCSFCSDTSNLDDLGWLIDEAHRQGLHVALDPAVWAKTQKPVDPNTGFYLASTPEGTIGDLQPFLVTFPSLMPQVMNVYADYMLQMAGVAQLHQAEAMFVGDGSNLDNTPGSLLWQYAQQWKTLFAQLRKTFSGKLWMGLVYGECGSPIDLPIWTLGDGINSAAAGGLTSGGPCLSAPAALNSLTAEQMVANMLPKLADMMAIQLKDATGLPLIWGEFTALPLDGVSSFIPQISQVVNSGIRDNQEIVDYFEAQMRTVGQKYTDGFFLWESDVSSGTGGNFADPLKQPALLSAVANWWAGDSSYLASCLTVAMPAGTLFYEDFEPHGCPLDKQDSMIPNIGWDLIQDPEDSANHVLRVSSQVVFLPKIPSVGGLTWTDYSVKLRTRLIGGPTEPVSSIYFRIGADGSAYRLQLGFNSLDLLKMDVSQNQYPTLAHYAVPGGTQLDHWYQLEILAVGTTITVQLDGTQVIETTDQNKPFSNGGVSLYVGSGLGAATVDFDDIEIDAVGQMLPVINDGRVVSAASYAPEPSVAPGGVASVFGSNLSAGLLQANTATLPSWLGLNGVSLLFNMTAPAPIYFVAPQQINVQIPWELSGQTQASLAVTVDGVSSTAQTVQLAPFAPAIFSMNQQGNGQGAILISNTDTIAAPVGSISGRNTRPVKRGEYISVYCTGLGDVSNRPASGAPAASSPLSTTLEKAAATIGGMAAKVSFSGLAPGFVGLYQINAQVPANAHTGDVVPVVITIGGANSNTVTIAVQ